MTKLQEARRANLKFFLIVLFIGQTVGLSLAWAYITYVTESSAKFFHAFVMWAGAGITFPLFSFSIRLMVIMQEKQIEQGEAISELARTFRAKDEKVTPLIDKVVTTVEERVLPSVEKVAAAIDKITKNNDLEETLNAIKEIPKLLKSIEKSGKKGLLDSL